MEHTIKLSFLTSDNKTISINVPRANPSVTGAFVRLAMDRIIDTHIVVTRAGEPAEVDKAELITTEVLEYGI